MRRVPSIDFPNCIIQLRDGENGFEKYSVYLNRDFNAAIACLQMPSLLGLQNESGSRRVRKWATITFHFMISAVVLTDYASCARRRFLAAKRMRAEPSRAVIDDCNSAKREFFSSDDIGQSWPPSYPQAMRPRAPRIRSVSRSMASCSTSSGSVIPRWRASSDARWRLSIEGKLAQNPRVSSLARS